MSGCAIIVAVTVAGVDDDGFVGDGASDITVEVDVGVGGSGNCGYDGDMDDDDIRMRGVDGVCRIGDGCVADVVVHVEGYRCGCCW